MFAFKSAKKSAASSHGLRNTNGGIIPPSLLEECRVPNFYKDAIAMCGATASNKLPNTASVYSLMVSSQLPKKTLGNIWSLVNKTHPGTLTREEFYACLALIALAQKGESLSALCGVTTLPIPYLQMFTVNTGPASAVGSLATDAPSDAENSKAQQSSSAQSTETAKKSCDMQQSNMDLLMEIDFNSAGASIDHGAENDSSFTAPGASDSQEVLHSLDNVNGEEGSLCANATHEEESNTAQLPSTSDKRRSKARDHEQTLMNALEKCSNAATEVFDGVTNLLQKTERSSVHDVLDTDRGEQMISSLLAIRLVLDRLHRSAEECERNLDESKSWLDVSSSWHGLSGILPLDGRLVDDDSSSQSFGEERVCSICFQSLLHTSIFFLGQGYHSECANFWINRVSSMLPQL